MADLIQIRRDTAANWTSANPTLAQGELGAEIDTNKVKIGDASTAWNSLDYLIDTLPSFIAGDDIASATAIDLTQATGSTVVITGTTESTSLVMTSGQQITLLPSGTWPMTFDATTMNINGGVDYTCSPGDRILAVKDLAGVIRVTVIKQDGTALVAAAAGVRYPQNSQSADYTLVIGDAGKSIFHPESDTDERTFTIPANASVAFDIGTIILFMNEYGAGSLDVAINADTIEDSSGNTGTVTLRDGNVLTALKVTSTKWMVWAENEIADPSYALAIAQQSAPGAIAYMWSSAGFGTRFADHGTASFYSAYDIAFSPSGTELVVAGQSAPYIVVFAWSASGFGTRFADPATLPTGTGLGVAFSPAGTEVAISHATSPLVTAYPWSASGFGTKFANPSTLPVGSQAEALAFSPAGTELVVGHINNPYITAYAWSASGFGTKFANPAPGLPNRVYGGLAFSPAGTELAVAHLNSPYVTAYAWSASGFGTKFANPSTLPTGGGSGVVFSPAGTEVIVGHSSSPYVSAYPWSTSGFGTKFANPATLPTGDGNGFAFSPTGTELIVAHSTAPWVTGYPWSASGFGTKFANPATIPTAVGKGAAFTAI